MWIQCSNNWSHTFTSARVSEPSKRSRTFRWKRVMFDGRICSKGPFSRFLWRRSGSQEEVLLLRDHVVLRTQFKTQETQTWSMSQKERRWIPEHHLISSHFFYNHSKNALIHPSIHSAAIFEGTQDSSASFWKMSCRLSGRKTHMWLWIPSKRRSYKNK